MLNSALIWYSFWSDHQHIEVNKENLLSCEMRHMFSFFSYSILVHLKHTQLSGVFTQIRKLTVYTLHCFYISALIICYFANMYSDAKSILLHILVCAAAATSDHLVMWSRLTPAIFTYNITLALS